MSTILHEAEELGQNRPYTRDEAKALVWLASIVGLWGACGGVLIAVALALWQEWPFVVCILIGMAAGFILAGAPILTKGVWEQLDGLRSWRKATTYNPQQPLPQLPIPETSPIIVRPYGGDPYVLQGNERLALPDGRQTALALNPPTVAAVLQEVIKQHGGQWSRSRLMRLRIDGQRVTRTLYEELTNALANSGFLQPQPNGGYVLPSDVQSFDDCRRYLDLGGREGGREGGKGGGNLAERRRDRWIECGCDIEIYRGKKHGMS